MAEEQQGVGGEQEGDERQEAPRSNQKPGAGWHGDPEGHAAAGRRGGEAVSRNRQHMAEIGRKGGEAVSKNREHMSQIGRKGGQESGGNFKNNRERASEAGRKGGQR